jgi:ribonuclease D
MPRRYSKPTKLPVLPELVVASPAELAQCLEHLAGCNLIGFDTEFVGEDAYRPELCLLQIATAERLYVIDPFAVGRLDAIWELLHDPGRVTVVHAGREDVRICHFQTGRPPANVFDVQLAAGLVGLTYPIGYSGLVYELLGQRMSKGETLTDWRRRPLLPNQVRYAFDDVRFLLPLWKKLTDRLKRQKRSDWATEEFIGTVRKAVAEEATVEKWRKLKGIGNLDRRGLAIAREVFAWRERFAERVNRPPRQLLRDDILTEIARRSPTKAEELAAFRGIPRNEIEPILEAVRRARALPANCCPNTEPRENDSALVVLLGNLLAVVLADWCARHHLAANLVATGSDLKALVRCHVQGDPLPDLPLTRGWRARTVLPTLQAVLDGSLAIRVENLAAVAPLGFLPVPTRESPQSPRDTL